MCFTFFFCHEEMKFRSLRGKMIFLFSFRDWIIGMESWYFYSVFLAVTKILRDFSWLRLPSYLGEIPSEQWGSTQLVSTAWTWLETTLGLVTASETAEGSFDFGNNRTWQKVERRRWQSNYLHIFPSWICRELLDYRLHRYKVVLWGIIGQD